MHILSACLEPLIGAVGPCTDLTAQAVSLGTVFFHTAAADAAADVVAGTQIQAGNIWVLPNDFVTAQRADDLLRPDSRVDPVCSPSFLNIC